MLQKAWKFMMFCIPKKKYERRNITVIEKAQKLMGKQRVSANRRSAKRRCQKKIRPVLSCHPPKSMQNKGFCNRNQNLPLPRKKHPEILRLSRNVEKHSNNKGFLQDCPCQEKKSGPRKSSKTLINI